MIGEIFKRRVREAQIWWLANEADDLRSTSLCVSGFAPDKKFLALSVAERQLIVEAIANKRADMLKIQMPYPAEESLQNGRILAFDPDHSLFDGASHAASDGFFNWDNVPAWNMWICYVVDVAIDKNYLLSWVPAIWIERVEEGIAVNCEGCIEWADKLNIASLQNL